MNTRIQFEELYPVLQHLGCALADDIPYRVFGSASLCARSPTAVSLRRAQGFEAIGDVDVVVSRGDMDGVLQSLISAGYARGPEISWDFYRIESFGSRKCFVWLRDNHLPQHLVEVWYDPVRVGDCVLRIDWSFGRKDRLLGLTDSLVFALQWPTYSRWSEPDVAKRYKRALDVFALLADFPLRRGTDMSASSVLRKLLADCSLWRQAFCALPLIEALLQQYFSEEPNVAATLDQLARLRRLLEKKRVSGRCRLAYGKVSRHIPAFV